VSDDQRRVSLDVIGAPRGPKVGAAWPHTVVLSEPMRRFQCNQKGCCCSGWDIPFRLEDFLRLYEHLPEDERAQLTKGIELVLEEEKNEQGEAILHALKLEGVGDDAACRFLETGGGCGVHRRHGLSALPDLCVDFPAFGYKMEDGRVEMWWDPVCPQVLEQLGESDVPVTLHRQEGRFGDGGLDLRVEHVDDVVALHVRGEILSPQEADRVRDACVAAFGVPDRAPWQALGAVLHSMVGLTKANAAQFEVRPLPDSTAFLQFLWNCIGAHGAPLLAGAWLRYRRFIYAMDPARIVDRFDVFTQHLQAWQPAFAAWLAPQDEVLRTLTARYLAHRFATPVAAGKGDLRVAADTIALIYGAALRFASAMGATLEQKVDREMFKVAIGAAESFYRSTQIAKHMLPWYASADLEAEQAAQAPAEATPAPAAGG
jgi:Fe-S-cluster containining protein